MEKHELINKAIDLKKANTSLMNKNKRLISLNKKLTEQLILSGVVKALPIERPKVTSALVPKEKKKCFWCGSIG